ncbi:MAG: hypothetical protein V4486_01975 [Patescibacteria group bacterium]
MPGDENKLKDSTQGASNPYQTTVSNMSFSLSYTKTNKLITALYMVTDILDQSEPLRNKLRTLGTEIISDIYSISLFSDVNRSIKVSNKITETISFLDLAGAVNIISGMNCNILKKEFFELKKSVEETIQKTDSFEVQTNLADYFKEELPPPSQYKPSNQITTSYKNNSIRHLQPARIGVQKGSTLMKALSDMSATRQGGAILNDLKKERREEIISIIKSFSNDRSEPIGATITDIKGKAKGQLATHSEKTLQRELIAMVTDNVLYKTGSKRWSRYFVTK